MNMESFQALNNLQESFTLKRNDKKQTKLINKLIYIFFSLGKFNFINYFKKIKTKS